MFFFCFFVFFEDVKSKIHNMLPVIRYLVFQLKSKTSKFVFYYEDRCTLGRSFEISYSSPNKIDFPKVKNYLKLLRSQFYSIQYFYSA